MRFKYWTFLGIFQKRSLNAQGDGNFLNGCIVCNLGSLPLTMSHRKACRQALEGIKKFTGGRSRSVHKAQCFLSPVGWGSRNWISCC